VNVPYELDQQVALYKLESLGIHIDSLSAEQKSYLDSWAQH
jgi:adenosylhomocysteinase